MKHLLPTVITFSHARTAQLRLAIVAVHMGEISHYTPSRYQNFNTKYENTELT